MSDTDAGIAREFASGFHEGATYVAGGTAVVIGAIIGFLAVVAWLLVIPAMVWESLALIPKKTADVPNLAYLLGSLGSVIIWNAFVTIPLLFGLDRAVGPEEGGEDSE